MTLARHGAIVVGAGVAGLSTALYLQRAGVAVAVIDPLPPAGGASFGNAGLLSQARALVDQRMQAFVDSIDLRAQRCQIGAGSVGCGFGHGFGNRR